MKQTFEKWWRDAKFNNGAATSPQETELAKDAYMAGKKSMIDWISVKNKLPRHTQHVLVCGSNKKVRCAHYSYGKWADYFGLDGTIEYWQEYPKPPKEKAE